MVTVMTVKVKMYRKDTDYMKNVLQSVKAY